LRRTRFFGVDVFDNDENDTNASENASGQHCFVVSTLVFQVSVVAYAYSVRR
jgi:hypothetical protein